MDKTAVSNMTVLANESGGVGYVEEGSGINSRTEEVYDMDVRALARI